MPLHIAQHKSYHPYNRDNIERVRRDEEEARGKQDDLDERAKVADAEARVTVLRRRRDGGGGEHEAEEEPSSSSSRAVGEPSSSRGRESSSSSKGRGKREQDGGGHEAMGVYLNELEKDGPAWYGDPHLKGPKDRRKTDEQRLEDAYRDSTLKSSHDPLTAMSSFLAQREEAKRQKAAPPAASPGREGEASISSYKHYVHSSAGQDFRERPQEIDPGGETSGTGAEIADETERAPTSADVMMTKSLDDTKDAVKREPVGSDMTIKTEQLEGIEGIALPTSANDPQSLDADASMSGNLDTSVNEMADTSAATSADSALEGASTRSPFAGESMYPTLLGEMIDVVLGQEAHLFDEKETTVLSQYAKLPYDARYLFSRLIQRKDTWHRLESLRQAYSKEITDIEPAVASLVDASAPRFLITHEDASSSGQEELLGLLTLDELKTLAKRMQANKPGTTKASIIAALLTTRSQGTLGSLFAAAAKKGSSSSTSSGGAQLSLGFNSQGKKSSQSTRLANEVTKLLGVLVRVDPPTRSLIDRVAFVFYRGSMLGGTALTTAVLSRSRRRNYPRYATQRSTDLFESRAHLLAYEEAIAVENEMEELLQWGDGSEATFSKALALFETVWPVWKKTVEDFDELEQQNRLSSYHRMRFHAGWPQTRVVYKGATILARFKLHAREEEVLQALLAQRHFRRGKRGEWYDRLALITAMYSPSLPGKPEPSARTTKQVTQAKTAALQIAVQGVEDPDTHLIYHDQLQRRICRLESQLPIPKSQKHDFSYAKLKSCAERTFHGVRLDVMEDASGATIDVASGQTLLAALPSPTTRSPTKASVDDGEAGATLPQGSRFQARAPLRKIVKVERQVSPVKGKGSAAGPFAGMKRDLSSSSDLLLAPPSPRDSPGMTRSPSASSSLDVSQLPEAVLSQYGYETARKERRTGMHSVWRGDDGAPCRVEELVLQRYAREGYEGRHDEGGMLKMLFALCMWDILFASGEVAVGEDGETIAVTDVFETPYQRAPLDLSEDSFAVTRAPLIRRRLALISSGGAPELVATVDARERPRATWAVGCRWDAFSTEDLVEVAGLIPGAALATVFQMMCEEWGHCSGGMPDLIVWRRPQVAEDSAGVKKEEGDEASLAPAGPEASLAPAARPSSSGGPSVKLCEVKGPGDKLSETQKVWIDVLLRAGLHVEVSLVREGDDAGAGAVKGDVKKEEQEEGFEVVGQGKSSEPSTANKKVKLDKETKSPSLAKKKGGWFTRGPPKEKG